MSDETTLLPCPFCGGEAETWDGAGPWHVVCAKCGTVGSPCLTEAEAIAAWNTRAAHGTLTAEQVREAIEKRFGFDVWVPEERWQAIADELNAELGSGTCELELNTDMTAIKCSECGYKLPKGADLTATNFCGGCGAKVVSA